MYGVQRLIAELAELGFAACKVTNPDGSDFAVIEGYKIPVGKFADRTIDLALPAPKDYPRSAGSSIHVRASPQLYEKSDTIPGTRNIVDSPLGTEWRYWSHNFGWSGERNTRRLMAQVNRIFADAT